MNRFVACLLGVLFFAIAPGFLFLLQRSSVPTLVTQKNSPLLTVVIMIKNEEPVIRQTLQPLVDAGIKHFFVYDTGSTDNTVAVTKEFFKEHHLDQAVLCQEPFVDFSTSRNRALALADQAFPQTSFMLMPDGEWYLQNAAGLVKFCEEHKQDENDCYAIRIRFAGTSDYINHRLIKGGAKVHFACPVHEYLDINGLKVGEVPNDVFFAWNVVDSGLQKSKKRWEWDVQVLEKYLQQHPDDGRTLFYLGQTYQGLGSIDKAIFYYEKRANLFTPNGETFWAQHRLAVLYESKGNWEKAMYFYLAASVTSPDRIEPLVNLGRHYLVENRFQEAYYFLQKTLHLECPQSPWLLDKDIYHYERYRLTAIAAWQVQQYDIGEDAACKALDACPKNNAGLLTSAQQVFDCYRNRRQIKSI